MPAGNEWQCLPPPSSCGIKIGINNINFILQTAKERNNLAILAVGNNKSVSVTVAYNTNTWSPCF